MSFASRLQQLVDQKSNGNAAEFARLCGVQDSSIRQYLKGTKPSLDNLIAIASATGSTLDWLATGVKQNSSAILADGPSGVTSILHLEISASAGNGAFSTGDSFGHAIDLPDGVIARVGAKPSYLRVLAASGASMEPTIGDGDLLLIDTSPGRRDPIVDGRIYVLSVGDALFVKRLRKSAKGWIMASDNRALYPDELLPTGEPIKVHGQVVWTGRTLS